MSTYVRNTDPSRRRRTSKPDISPVVYLSTVRLFVYICAPLPQLRNVTAAAQVEQGASLQSHMKATEPKVRQV